MLTIGKYTFAHDFEVDNIYYTIISNTDKTCKVTNNGGKENSYSGSVIIPEKVIYDNTTYSIVEIDNSTFKNCIKLKAVSLPNSIVKLGNGCFSGCISLSSFSVPCNVETLPGSCFEGCISLESVELNNVKIILGGCFRRCSSMEEIKIPSCVSEIGSYSVFSGCASLKTITFEDGSETLKLGYDLDYHCGLFGNCPLDSVYVGRNLSYKSCNSYSDGTSTLNPFDMGKGNNNTLRSVFISTTVSELSEKLFYKCSKLEHIYGMQKIKKIGDYAFCGTAIRDITMGNDVTDIGQCVLSSCSSLEKVILGDSIQDLTSKLLCYDSFNINNLYIGKGLKSFARDCFCSSYGGSTQSPLASANVYLFSDEVTSNYFYEFTTSYEGGLPRDVKALYVANPERYQTLFGKDYNLKPMLVFNESTLEYTGKAPELSYKNYVEDFDVTFDNATTPKDAGSYTTNVNVTFATKEFDVSVEIPCSYTITKAPLKLIANSTQRFYGEENPELSCLYIGFKNNETEDVLTSKPILTTIANKESNAGTYPIYCTGAEAKNYNMDYVAGTLTVNKAPQEIVWEQDFENQSIGDEIELTAISSAGLPVKYKSSNNSSVIVTSKNGKQYAYILKSGITVLTAYQNGDINHEEADEINKVINVQTTSVDSLASEFESNKFYNLNGIKTTAKTNNIIIVKGEHESKKIFKRK